MRSCTFISIVTAAIGLTALGCGGGSADKTGGDGGNKPTGGATPDLSAPAGPTVGTLCVDSRADNWTLPLTKPTKSGALNVTLLSSSASIPLIGDSTTTWKLALADASTGAPVDGATVTVLPWMPDHGHGTSVRAVVTAVAGAPGEYAMEPLYFFMAGYWTVTLSISAAPPDGGAGTAAVDTVVFSLCLTDAT